MLTLSLDQIKIRNNVKIRNSVKIRNNQVFQYTKTNIVPSQKFASELKRKRK